LSFLEKHKVELPYDLAIPLLGIYPEESKSAYNKGTCIPMFAAVLFTIAKPWKQPRCLSADEWQEKVWYKQWSVIYPQRRMKVCGLQESGWS
jgi:hypothetical protein